MEDKKQNSVEDDFEKINLNTRNPFSSQQSQQSWNNEEDYSDIEDQEEIKKDDDPLKNSDKPTLNRPVMNLVFGEQSNDGSLYVSSKSEVKEADSSLDSEEFESSKLENYTIGPEIGHGGFGFVFEAKNKDGVSVAIKKIHIKDKFFERSTLNEIKINEILSGCENVTKMIDSFSVDNFYYLVFEYSSTGDLFSYILKNKEREKNLSFVKDVIKQICTGLSCCHKNSICHRDIKPENILVFPISNEKTVYKLCDFGLSNYTDKLMNSATGTRNFLAPEVRNKKPYYCNESDMWSIGVLTFVIFFIANPFGNGIDINESSIRNRINFIDDKQMKNFVSNLLVIDPEKRMTVEEALKHPFLKN